MKIIRSNGEPLFSNKSLIKHPSTRLRFSMVVIAANFIIGIVGMVLGADLTALGVFLSLANSPLYVYVLGSSFRASTIPDGYFNQAHTGAGGLGTLGNTNANVNINTNNNIKPAENNPGTGEGIIDVPTT